MSNEKEPEQSGLIEQLLLYAAVTAGLFAVPLLLLFDKFFSSDGRDSYQ